MPPRRLIRKFICWPYTAEQWTDGYVIILAKGSTIVPEMPLNYAKAAESLREIANWMEMEA